MKRLKIVQIGVGHDHALCAWQSIKKQSDLFEVLGWCPADEEAVAGNKQLVWFPEDERLSLADVLARTDLDAVAVEAEDRYLTKYAQLFAERGIAVQMDKPGSASQESFEKLMKTVREKKIAFQLGYMYRHNPTIAQTVAEARRGDFGEISAVEVHMDCEHGKEKRDWLADYPGGMLYFLGCHLIDIILQIKGVPDEILPLSFRSGYGGAVGEDVGMAVLRYPHCVAFAKTSAVEAGGMLRRQLVVTGEKRSVELRPLEGYVDDGELLYTGKRDCEIGKGWRYDGEKTVSAPHDRYDDMFAAFASFVRGEKQNPFTPEYECRLHRVLLAACGQNVDYKAPIDLK